MFYRPQLNRTRDNLVQQGWLWWPFLIGSLLDGHSTYRFLTLYGHQAEAHPVIAMVAALTGPLGGAVLGKLGQFAGLLVLSSMLARTPFRRLVLATSAAYLLAASFNYWQLWRYG